MSVPSFGGVRQPVQGTVERGGLSLGRARIERVPSSSSICLQFWLLSDLRPAAVLEGLAFTDSPDLVIAGDTPLRERVHAGLTRRSA